MSPPRVTVLIGTWNNAETLPRAIDSILRQTLGDLELIVVDDGSTDQTPEIVRKIDDDRIRYMPLVHQGIPRSLNVAIGAATAPVIAVQDADDWSLPERLERQLAVLEADPSVAVVGCRMREVDEDGRAMPTPRLPLASGDVRNALLRFNPIPNTAAAFRRDVVVAHGGFDPRFRYAMDYDLWCRISNEHRVVNIPECLAVRTMGDGNAGALREREQIRETIRIRVETYRHRRAFWAVPYLARPIVSLLLPLRIKRAYRRLRGKAP